MRNASRALIMAALSIGAGWLRAPMNWNDPPQGWRKSYGKRGGGRGGKRYTSPRYRAWKKAFGGLAVPSYTE